MADAEKKLGTYICTGCDIGAAVDIEALVKVAQKECKAAVCKTHACLCGDEGVATIRQDIADEGLTNVVVAACSPRAKQQEFAFEGTYIERCNLREGVAWVCEPGDEDTQWLAEDYIRMSSERCGRAALPVPWIEGEYSKDILVVGGGIAGLTAALGAAKAGYKVHLVEKEQTLGGYLSKMHRSVPTRPPYKDLEELDRHAAGIDAVQSHPKITVHKEAEIEKIDGAPCKFEVQLKAGGAEVKLNAGAIILATGFEPYDASKLGHLGYGQFKDVVTSVELEQMAVDGKIVRPSDGAPVRSALFIQCAGSRDPEHLPYCSTVCCGTTLKQAAYLKQADAGAQSYVLYKDIRTPGQREELYREAQRQGTVFIRGELNELAQQGGKLSAFAKDLLLDDVVELADLDLVVLATGMVPTTLMEGETVEPLAGEDVMKPRILKLNYRQGPELPNFKYGYPDSHFICFPYETRRTGIYAAGTVRRAMDAASARQDALGAALKAIQCVELTSRGEAVHPRAGDMSWPDLFMQRCTQCKRCTEECPFGTFNEDEKANPLPNPTRCRRCGTCMGACPERIISFKDYAVDQIGAQLKAMEVPDEDEEKPAVLAFVCENDAYPVLDALAARRSRLSPYVRFIPLRCMGGVNLVWIADALSSGIDGVLFLGCKHGDDYQCHYVKGSELCNTRLEKISETLERLVLESERIRFEQISMNDLDRVTTIVEEFMETIEEVGPNPYKGF